MASKKPGPPLTPREPKFRALKWGEWWDSKAVMVREGLKDTVPFTFKCFLFDSAQYRDRLQDGVIASGGWIDDVALVKRSNPGDRSGITYISLRFPDDGSLSMFLGHQALHDQAINDEGWV